MVKLSTKTKVLWSIMMVLLIGYQIAEFLRMRRQHVRLFASEGEMYLVIAFVAVFLMGVVYKSRQNR